MCSKTNSMPFALLLGQNQLKVRRNEVYATESSLTKVPRTNDEKNFWS